MPVEFYIQIAWSRLSCFYAYLLNFFFAYGIQNTGTIFEIIELAQL